MFKIYLKLQNRKKYFLLSEVEIKFKICLIFASKIVAFNETWGGFFIKILSKLSVSIFKVNIFGLEKMRNVLKGKNYIPLEHNAFHRKMPLFGWVLC